MQMKEMTTGERTSIKIAELSAIWETSVKATHLFLSDGEIEEIKQFIPQALKEIPHLIVAENERGLPVAFMGVEGQKLEMLFISSDERGKGLGKELIQYGIEHYSINEVAVNEQNPLALGFYEHMGFQTYKRTDRDEQGKPYPLFYMRLNGQQPVCRI